MSGVDASVLESLVTGASHITIFKIYLQAGRESEWKSKGRHSEI